MGKEVILKVEHINKNFGETVALKDINFSITKGSIHSLVGKKWCGEKYNCKYYCRCI